MKFDLCEQLGIEFPLLAFSHCRNVVAAVTNAGGFGVLGANSHSPDQLERELCWIDDHPNGKPYGADIIVPAKFVGKEAGLNGTDLPGIPQLCRGAIRHPRRPVRARRFGRGRPDGVR